MSVTSTEKMNSKRFRHGIGILTLDGEDKVAIFGGSDGNVGRLDSVEVYDQETLKWTNRTDITLEQARSDFGFLTVKHDEIPGF